MNLDRASALIEGPQGLPDLQNAVIARRDGLGASHVVYRWVSAEGE